MATTTNPTAQQPSEFNPLAVTRTSPEFLVGFLEQIIDAKLTAEKKAAVLSVMADLPDGATMLDLYEAIKAQEAATLGITPEQYEGLSPALEALQGLLAPGAHSGIFEQAVHT
jgi:hypothetical protein